jgi:hypothetical protein
MSSRRKGGSAKGTTSDTGSQWDEKNWRDNYAKKNNFDKVLGGKGGRAPIQKKEKPLKIEWRQNLEQQRETWKGKEQDRHPHKISAGIPTRDSTTRSTTKGG